MYTFDPIGWSTVAIIICIATPLLINLLAGTSTPCREIQSTVSVETRIEHDANAINGSSSVYW